jgi:hypothetical protein
MWHVEMNMDSSSLRSARPAGLDIDNGDIVEDVTEWSSQGNEEETVYRVGNLDSVTTYLTSRTLASVELWTMLACVCTPPDARLFSTLTGAGGTEIKAPTRRRITVPPSFTGLPVPTTHLPSRRSPSTAVTNSVVVTSPPLTSVEFATPGTKENEDHVADTEVSCAAVQRSTRCKIQIKY